jgi:hypothetical protein
MPWRPSRATEDRNTCTCGAKPEPHPERRSPSRAIEGRNRASSTAGQHVTQVAVASRGD